MVSKKIFMCNLERITNHEPSISKDFSIPNGGSTTSMMGLDRLMGNINNSNHHNKLLM
jgi:hypothetical protein